MTFKEFRLSQGLSQPKIAKALGIGVSTVGAYELGRIHPSAKVLAKIKEVFGVDLNEATEPAPAEAAPAEPVPVVEEKVEKPAKRTRKKKEDAAEAAPAEPVPAVEETPAKTKHTRKKKEAAVEAAPAPAAEEKVESPAPKHTRARKKTTPTVIIQSIMGGEINVEEVIAKVGDVDAIYVKPEENAAYWVRGDESGAVNLW